MCVCVCTFLFLISAVLFCCAIPFSVGKRQATPISRLIEGRIILDSVKEEQVARRRNDHKNKAKKERKKGATWSAFYYYFVRKKKDVRLTLRGRTEKRRRRGNCYITLMLFSLLLLCLPFYLCCVPVCFCRRNPSASLSLRFVTSISRALQPPLVVVGIIWNVVERIERIKWDKKEREWRRKKGCGWEGLETRFHLFWLYSIRQKKNRWIRERREGPAWLKGATRQIPIFNVHSTSNLACVCVYARVCVCGEAVLVGKSGKCCGWEKNFSNLHLVVESHGLA